MINWIYKDLAITCLILMEFSLSMLAKIRKKIDH